MRLRTELRRDDGGARYAHDPDPYQANGAVAHDAAAAHALMQAMDEFDGAEYQRGYILHRASEILRSWGFDSGEVE